MCISKFTFLYCDLCEIPERLHFYNFLSFFIYILDVGLVVLIPASVDCYFILLLCLWVSMCVVFDLLQGLPEVDLSLPGQ